MEYSYIYEKKKVFTDSTFYDEPHHIYPTVKEQVELCRKIADSLSADSNRLSRGASMYEKRKKRADKWVFEGPDPNNENSSRPNSSDSWTSASYTCESNGGVERRKLKLVLDPRQLQDATRLRNSGLYNEHNVISPDICFDLVKDLNSPVGKGAALFAKRKKKAESWVVDENTVKQKMMTEETTTIPKEAAVAKDIIGSALLNPRLKLIKSPWEAALESPIGSCDAAFQEVPRRHVLFDRLLVQPLQPDLEVRLSPPAPPDVATPAPPWKTEQPHIYKPKAPKGWHIHAQYETRELTPPGDYRAPVSSLQDSTAWTPNKFTNFNTKAHGWAESAPSAGGFRSVRPASLFLP